MTAAIHVLVLDDEQAIRESLAAHLEDDGFTAASVESAEEALAEMETTLPDAVVVDLRLPGMDGTSFIFEAHGRWSNVVFVIYTGSQEYRMQQELTVLPRVASKVFLKPLVDLQRLSEEIRRAVAEQVPPAAS